MEPFGEPVHPQLAGSDRGDDQRGNVDLARCVTPGEDVDDETMVRPGDGDTV